MKIISLNNLKYVMKYLRTRYTAPQATCDADGNDIQETYLKKSDKVVNSAYADSAARAVHAVEAEKATNDALGRDISKTYVSAAGGKVEGELHISQPSENDNSDRAATTSWVTTQISKAVPSKKVDGSMQTWDINVSGYAETSKEAETLGVHKELGATSDNPYAAMNCDDFDTVGIYKISYASGDALPPGCNGEIWIFNLYHGDLKSASMIAVSPKSNQMYTGHFADSKWNGWKKIANAEDISNDAPTKTGAGASGTWGIDISGNAATATTAANAAHATTADSATNANTATVATTINNGAKNMTMHWSGQPGQPTWLWGGNDGENMYVYNPANFTFGTAKNVPTSDVGGNFWIS